LNFLSGGAASTTVRLHIKYETKQEPGPRPGRQPSSGAQNTDFGAARMDRRIRYDRSRVLWRNVARPPADRWPSSSTVHGWRGARATVGRAASRVRNRTRHRRRVWLVAAASKPVGRPPAIRWVVGAVRSRDGPFAGWRNDVRHRARNRRTDETTKALQQRHIPLRTLPARHQRPLPHAWSALKSRGPRRRPRTLESTRYGLI